MLLRYFANDFEKVPGAHIIAGNTFVFTFNGRCISVVRSLYCKVFSTFFFKTFLSLKIEMLINTHVSFFIITDYDVRFIVRDGCQFALLDSII